MYVKASVFDRVRRFMTLRALVFSWFGILAMSLSHAYASENMIVGVGVHRLSDTAFQSRTLTMASQAGFKSMRTDLKWTDVEKTRGLYVVPRAIDESVQSALRLGMEPLLILDYGNPLYGDGKKPIAPEVVQAYVRYTEAVVRHFGNKIHYYEIWNEWDNGLGGTEPGHVDDYAALVKAAYPAIKGINRGSTVLVGAVTEKGLKNGWYERLAQLGALQYADGLSVHPYGFHKAPACSAEHAIGWLDALQSVLKVRYGIELPVFITEAGWPTNQGKFGVSETVQADLLSRFFTLAASRSYIHGFWWYDLVDDTSNPSDKEANFGLLRFSTLEPKPSWSTVRTLLANQTRRRYANDWQLPQALTNNACAN
jgi:polysaccharide biosynthesis protein PslG